jgi:hypothetical protein
MNGIRAERGSEEIVGTGGRDLVQINKIKREANN